MLRLKLIINFNMDNLKYIVTRDRKLISQYIKLVEDLYKKDLKIHSYDVDLEEFIQGNNVIVLVVTEKGEVCGGGTLYLNELGKSILPCEKDAGIDLFSIKSSLNCDIISETSKVVIVDEYRKYSFDILCKLYLTIIEEACKRGLKSIYTVNYKSVNKLSKKILSKLGFNYIPLPEIEIPSAPIYNGIEMQLSMVDLSSLDSSVKEVL